MGSSKVKTKIIKDLILNFVLNKRYGLSYIVESGDWSIKMDGEYITKNLNKVGVVKARTTKTYLFLRSQIIHFGSFNTFVTSNGFKKPHSSNKTVVTCFHFVPNDPRLKFVIEAEKYVDLFHTSCNVTKESLISFGVKLEKIVTIPLGVDLSIFMPASFEEKKKIKKHLGIHTDKIVIGSFQKDGVGWGEGLEPKLIKGPDIFVKVIERLAKNHSVFALLVGPARGYVKSELRRRNISYKDVGYLKDLREIAKYYHAIDLYLITSRIEGGPKQVLEAWASGTPAVGTKVGMIPDIASDGENILLSNVDDINQIANKAKEIIQNEHLKVKLIKNGLERVRSYSWENISERYFSEIYSKLQ